LDETIYRRRAVVGVIQDDSGEGERFGVHRRVRGSLSYVATDRIRISFECQVP
jgi:hypothetical protein